MHAGGRRRQRSGDRDEIEIARGGAISGNFRGHQRHAHLEGGGVDDRYKLATARIERRTGARGTAGKRVDELGLLILRVGKVLVQSEVIMGTQRSSWAISANQGQ